MDSFDADELIVSDMYKTFVKLETVKEKTSLHRDMEGFDHYGGINRCCEKHTFKEETITKLTKWYPRANDIRRIPCDKISRTKFETDYVSRGKPVILKGYSNFRMSYYQFKEWLPS